MNKNVQKLCQKISLVILFVILGFTTMGYPAYGYADMGLEKPLVLAQDLILSSYSYELKCNQRVVLIRWESEFAEDITNYRIRRRTLTGYTDDMPIYDNEEWITPLHIVAVPLGKYKTIDASIEMSVDYNYQLYGFGANLDIVNAKVADLDEVISFNCIYLPMIYS